MDVNKLDSIYSLAYDNQIMHYLDDVLFQDDNEDLGLSFETPRISELSKYIEEFTELYLNENHFYDSGRIRFKCGKISYDCGEIPKIKNDLESTVYLMEEKTKRFSIEGDPKIEVEYILEIDISKNSIQIEKDIKKLMVYNNFFNFFELVSKNMNVKTYEQFCVVINSARIDTLLEMKWSFMVLEYCHLRKYAFLSIEGAKRAIEIIYA